MSCHDRRHHLPRGVRRLPDGRWRARVYATDARTGRPREAQRTWPAGMTLPAVLSEVDRLRSELSRGAALAPAARLRLSDCAERWLEDAAARTKRSTSELYLDVLGRRVLPVLGDVFIDALARPDIEGWVRWAEAQRKRDGQPYGHASLKGWWRVMVQFIRDVCADHGLPDPIVRVRPPRGRRGSSRETRTLSPAELARLLAATQVVAPRRYAEVYALIHTGMRPGELYALRWSDVDAERMELTVRRGVYRGTVDTPKTGDGRALGLTDGMLAVLRAHRQRQLAERRPGFDSGLVFPSLTGGHRGPESLHKPLRKAAAAAGVPIRVGPLVLRRTFNTLMLQSGVDRIVLRSQMGHCSEQMTERYAGVPVAAKRGAVAELERRIASVASEGCTPN